MKLLFVKPTSFASSRLIARSSRASCQRRSAEIRYFAPQVPAHQHVQRLQVPVHRPLAAATRVIVQASDCLVSLYEATKD